MPLTSLSPGVVYFLSPPSPGVVLFSPRQTRPRAYTYSGGEGEKVRMRIAEEVLEDALDALKEAIDIAIVDASYVTSERRRWLADAVAGSGLHCQASEHHFLALHPSEMLLKVFIFTHCFIPLFVLSIDCIGGLISGRRF